ncbi:MAG: hypothetical protein Q8S17_04550, partial [Humidesulfovibrio sp.]|nr:hypothetical protein [Humidesulfovibrio sp.]
MTASRACRPTLLLRFLPALLLALALFALGLGAPPAFGLDIPHHGGQWVLDTAGLLPPGDKD